MQIDRQTFDFYQYRTKSGLFTHDPEIVELSRQLEEIQKARGDRQLTAAEREFDARAGAFFNALSVWNNLFRYGAAEKPAGTETHRTLRDFSKQSDMDALIINARLFQIRHLAQQVIVEGKQKGFVVRHKRWSDKNFKMTKEVESTCREISDVVFNPNPEFHPEGFRDVLVKFTQGEMILDRKCMVVMRNRQGKPLSWHVLPPDDIRPRLEVLLRHMPENRLPGMNGASWSMRTYRTPEDQQKLLRQVGRLRQQDFDRANDAIFRKFGIDASNAAWIQDVDGYVTGAWTEDECKVDVTSPSDEINMWRYGISSLERSLNVSSMLMYAINYNRSLFLKNYPEAMIMIHGNVNSAGLEVFRQQIYAEIGPEMGAARLPVVSTGGALNKAELLKLRDSIRDMEMPQFIRLFTSLKCSAYRCHPSLLNLNPDRGDARPVIGNFDEAFNIDLSQEEGLGSLAETQAKFLTHGLWAKDYEPWRDYEVFPVLDKILTESEVIELWDKKLKTGGYVVDELRSAQGDVPFEKVSGGVKGDYAPNDYYFRALEAQQQASEQELQQLLGQPNPGEEDEQGQQWTVGNEEEPMTFDQPQQQWTMGE